MTVAYETTSASSCLKLPSMDVMEGDVERDLECASILDSMRGSTESSYQGPIGTPRELSQSSVGLGRAEEFMSARPFMLASYATTKGSELQGSGDAFLCFVGGSQDGLSSAGPRAGSVGLMMQRESSFGGVDRPTALPNFPPRGAGSVRPLGRSSSLCRATSDLLGPFASRGTSRSGSFDALRLGAAPSLGGRSTSKDNFLDLIANTPCPTAASASALAVRADYKVALDEGEEGGEAAGAKAEEEPQQPEVPAQRPLRAAAVKAASRVQEEEDDDESESEEEAPKRRGAAPKRKGGASSAGARGRKRAKTEELGRSGLHVRERPDMQKKARDGQEHWLQQVRSIRRVWQDRREWEREGRYQAQVDTCASMQIKSQHECLLRTLQMAATDGQIVPLPFKECGPESFLGWTGFQVVMEHAQAFRARIDTLFPAPLKENTLHTSFRRAGLVPDKWSSGWLGLTPFKFSHDKRVAYAPTPAAAAAARGGA